MCNPTDVPKILQNTYIPTSEFYSQIIDSLIDYSIFTMNTALIINSWNSGAKGIFQYEAKEILGKPFHSIFTEEDNANGVPEKEIQLAIKEGKAIDNRWHVCKDGKRFFAYGLVFPLLGIDGELLGFVKILRDITEKKTTADAIDAYVKDLEILNTHKESVISILSHDLRSPLTGFISLLEHTRTNLQDISQLELEGILDLLYNSAIKELHQLDQLVEWGRIKYASETFLPIEINLAHVIKKVLGILSENILAKSVDIVNNTDESFFVFADFKMIQSILQNLISNAIRHSDYRGTITISAIHEERISIICVTDSGSGMNEETLSKIFTPQLNLLSEPRSSNSGAGIGLLLTKNLIEKHGGEIWAKSIELKGSSFFFSLPQKDNKDDESKVKRKAFFEDYKIAEEK